MKHLLLGHDPWRGFRVLPSAPATLLNNGLRSSLEKSPHGGNARDADKFCKEKMRKPAESGANWSLTAEGGPLFFPSKKKKKEKKKTERKKKKNTSSTGFAAVCCHCRFAGCCTGNCWSILGDSLNSALLPLPRTPAGSDGSPTSPQFLAIMVRSGPHRGNQFVDWAHAPHCAAVFLSIFLFDRSWPPLPSAAGSVHLSRGQWGR